MLAVREDLAGKAVARINESEKVFSGKSELFRGERRSVVAFDEARKQGINEEKRTEVTTTVPARLDFTFEAVIALLDVEATIDDANCHAKADLELGEMILLRDVPSTTLLTIEKQCKVWMEKLSKPIPTRANGVAWEEDKDSGAHIWKLVHPEVVNKTEKQPSVFTLHPATDKHPANVEKIINEVPIGKITTYKFSGEISSAEKEAFASRIQALGEAAKQARMRANAQTVTQKKIGDTIVKYLMGPFN